jgi:hypothetical protein
MEMISLEKTKFFYSDSNDNFRSSPPTEFALWRLTVKFGSEKALENIITLIGRPTILELFLMFDYTPELSIKDIRQVTGWNYNYIKRVMGDLVDLGLIKGVSYDKWRLD